jgi:hypothetical protein
MMGPLQLNTAVLPPPLRALALGLLVETPVSLHARSRQKGPVFPDQGEGGTGKRTELWQVLRDKCGEVSVLVLQADDSREAAAYVLDYLENVFALIQGPAISPLEPQPQGPELAVIAHLLQVGCRPRP